jgi:hypothetical protein
MTNLAHLLDLLLTLCETVSERRCSTWWRGKGQHVSS